MDVYSAKVGILPDCCGAIVLHSLFKNRDPYSTVENFLVSHPWNEATWRYHGFDTEEKKLAYVKGSDVNAKAETVDEYKDRIEEFIKKYQDYYKGKRSYILVSLNPKEAEHLHDIVIRCGFEILVPETRNPNGSSITLYIFHLLPKVQEEMKSVLS